MNEKEQNTYPDVLRAVCAAVNFVGGLTALTLRLPVYLDSIGTILAAIVLGPFYGMLTGFATSVINVRCSIRSRSGSRLSSC